MHKSTTLAPLRAYAIRLIAMQQESSMYTDEHIEHWAAVYVAQRLEFTLGVSFEEFLARPASFRRVAELAATAERLMLGEYAPLLARQRRVQARLDGGERGGAPQRPGRPPSPADHPLAPARPGPEDTWFCPAPAQS